MKTLVTFGGAAAGAIAGAWAFATLAAQHVIDPHLAQAKIRVHIMCEQAKVQQANQLAICDAVGAKCSTIDPNVITASCEEP